MNDLYLENEYDDGAEDMDGHRDRIRRRIADEGVGALKPLQILEFILYYALPRQDVEDVAQNLMEHFGDLQTIFRASLDDFRRVEGLGETGAVWMDQVCRCMGAFVSLKSHHSIVVENQRQLLGQARALRDIVPVPCCVQLLTDKNALLTLRRPIGYSKEWAQLDILRQAMADVSAVGAKNAYMIVYTDRLQDHPTIYDRTHIHDYALLLKHSGCTLQDVLFVDGQGSVSMRRMNLIPDMNQRKNLRRFVAEDEVEAMLEKDLKIIIPNKEANHDRPEPV